MTEEFDRGVSPIEFTPEEEREDGIGNDGDLRDTSDEYYALPASERSRTRLWSVISLTLVILSAVLCPFWQVGVILGALGIGFALLSRHILGFFDGIALWGLVVGIFGFVFCLCSMVIDLTGVMDSLLGER